MNTENKEQKNTAEAPCCGTGKKDEGNAPCCCGSGKTSNTGNIIFFVVVGVAIAVAVIRILLK